MPGTMRPLENRRRRARIAAMAWDRRLAGIVVLLLSGPCFAVGCRSPARSAAPARTAPRPWTRTFMEPAVLLADTIRIEGPEGLLGHVATRPDPELHERTERAVPDGFMQEIIVRGHGAGGEIRAWLDRLEIVALKRLTVLERPAAVDVVVQASGDAFWRPIQGGEELRRPSLRLVGAPPP
jgi:hypothetical protein